MTRRIGITIGEPHGIGPELLVRTLSKPEASSVEYSIYGSPRLLEATAHKWDISPFWERMHVVPCGPDPKQGLFENQIDRARAVIESLDRISDDALAGRLDAIVTAPIDKGIVRQLLPTFTGHTGYLAERAGIPRTVMMLDNTEIRVALLTEHIALREVPEAVTAEAMEATLRVVAGALQERFGVPHPRIALAGLNPHAGEINKDPEEQTVMAPLVEKLRGQGWQLEGPFAADSLYPLARGGKWDVILAPYHDQGLVAAKYPGLDKVVNITLGLPYLRVSPGHGVAYDIAGKRPADTRSFERALRMAVAGRLVA